MMSGIKINVLSIFYMVLALYLSSCSDSLDFDFENETPYKVETIPLDDAIELDVYTSGGRIRVIGTDQPEAVIEMYIKAHNDNVDKYIKDYEISIGKDGDKIIAHAKKVRNKFTNKISINFLVYIPYSTECKVNTSGGEIEMSHLYEGQQRAESSGGNLYLEDISGSLSVYTAGGNIDLTESNGNMELETGGGNIKATDCIGSFSLSSEGGNIVLASCEGSVNARTDGGKVEADMLDIANELTLSSGGGDVSALVPAENGMNLYLKGSIVESSLTNFEGSQTSDLVDGKMNGGGIPVRMTTSGGKVILRFR